MCVLPTSEGLGYGWVYCRIVDHVGIALKVVIAAVTVRMDQALRLAYVTSRAANESIEFPYRTPNLLLVVCLTFPSSAHPKHSETTPFLSGFQQYPESIEDI